MSHESLLVIDGQVDRPAQLSRAELGQLPEKYQVADVSQLDPQRRGAAVTLAGLLDAVGPHETVKYLTLHAGADDFHASIPLAAVRARGVLIYELDGASLPAAAGGPFRFLIPDYAACRTDEIDECANVKFVDRIELSAERGRDNRPHDEAQHAALHKQTQSARLP